MQGCHYNYATRRLFIIKSLKLSYFFGAFLASLGGIALMNQATIVKQLDDWQLLPRSERLTELYFTDSRLLPVSLKSGATQEVPFTVRNLEHRTTAYQYKLVALPAQGGTEQLLKSGTFMLTHEHSQVINPTITIPSLGNQIAVRIDLEYGGIAFGSDVPRAQKQSIHYWIKVASVSGSKGNYERT